MPSYIPMTWTWWSPTSAMPTRSPGPWSASTWSATRRHWSARVDLADLPGYCDVNVTGTATLLNAMGQAGAARLVLASSMVVYGEGAYDCASHGRVRPAPRAREDLMARQFEPRCPRCGQALSTATVTEDAPMDRATPTRPANWPRSIWPPRGPGSPAAGPSPCATTTCTVPGCRETPLLRSGGHLPVGTGKGRTAPGLRGRPTAAGLRARVRRAMANLLALASTRTLRPAACGATTSPAAIRTPWARWRPRWRLNSAAVWCGDHRGVPPG